MRSWLKTEGMNLPRSNYIADIGFCARPDALGGGPVICTELMTMLLSIGMEIFLSEYPPTKED
ncbi:hypothetical protein [Rubritalea tangerina]|uniref:hypothetical protein n=1 Tax=Rubritalea tangerina TaxID=430798 RepID=UPI00360E7289